MNVSLNYFDPMNGQSATLTERIKEIFAAAHTITIEETGVSYHSNESERLYNDMVAHFRNL